MPNDWPQSSCFTAAPRASLAEAGQQANGGAASGGNVRLRLLERLGLRLLLLAAAGLGLLAGLGERALSSSASRLSLSLLSSLHRQVRSWSG